METHWSRPKFDFVDPREQPFVEMKSRGELPHLYKECGSYFATFRLWDAIESKADSPRHNPRHHLLALMRELYDEQTCRDAAFARRLATATEPPLKAGSCLLRRADVAKTIVDTLQIFHEQRYLLTAWCVMPNHVHVTYTALGQHTPEDIHHSWKSYTSHEINRMANRTGPLWERESFDHLIRSIEHYEAFITYIERNPVEAGICKKAQDWKFSSASCENDATK